MSAWFYHVRAAGLVLLLAVMVQAWLDCKKDPRVLNNRYHQLKKELDNQASSPDLSQARVVIRQLNELCKTVSGLLTSCQPRNTCDDHHCTMVYYYLFDPPEMRDAKGYCESVEHWDDMMMLITLDTLAKNTHLYDSSRNKQTMTT